MMNLNFQKTLVILLFLVGGMAVSGQQISYQWSTGDTTVNFQANPSQTTTYYVTVTQYGVSYVDSVTIVVNQPSATSTTISECNSYTWSVNNQTYTTTGVYVDTLTNSANCDSVVTLNLTIHNSNSGSENITACDSYTWLSNNQIYSSSGTYFDTLQNIFGCDSVVTLNLTVNQSTTSADTALSVSQYVWPLNGNTLITTGQYFDTLVNAKGCDSIITLELTIVPPLIVNATLSDSVICDGGVVTVGVTTTNYTFSPPLTDSIFNNSKSYGFVTDNEGNTYRTIQIGSQIWMAENLRTTKFENGDPIPNLSDSSVWDSVTYAAFSKYPNPTDNYYYGNLYNFYAANDSRNICPTGWHVPSHSEFRGLIGQAFVNPTGGSLKSISGLWNAPNVNATNSKGFSALPGGVKNNTGGSMWGIGSNAAFWSKTPFNSSAAWGIFLYNSNNDASRYGGAEKNEGYSIRCLKD